MSSLSFLTVTLVLISLKPISGPRWGWSSGEDELVTTIKAETGRDNYQFYLLDLRNSVHANRLSRILIDNCNTDLNESLSPAVGVVLIMACPGRIPYPPPAIIPFSLYVYPPIPSGTIHITRV